MISFLSNSTYLSLLLTLLRPSLLVFAKTYIQISLAIIKPSNNDVVVLHVVRSDICESKSNPASGFHSYVKRYRVVLIVKCPPQKKSALIIRMGELRRVCGKKANIVQNLSESCMCSFLSFIPPLGLRHLIPYVLLIFIFDQMFQMFNRIQFPST